MAGVAADTEIASRAVKKESENNWTQLAWLLAGAGFLGNGTLGITKALLSVLLKSLGFTGTQIGLISGARGFKAIADVPAGYVSDKFGRKKAAYIGQALLVVSHWVMGWGYSFQALFTGRLLHGAGAGFNAGAATFGAADLAKRARGLGQGFVETVNYGAHTLFAAASGYLAVKYGVRYPFFVLSLTPIPGGFIIWKYLKEPRDAGAAPEPHRINLRDAGRFTKSLLANPGLLSLFYVGMLTKFVDDGVLTMLMPLWLKSKGAGVGEIALAATCAHGAFAFTVAAGGLFADWKGRKTAVTSGAVLLMAGVFAVSNASALPAVIVTSMLIAFGNALVYPAVPAATADIVPDHLRATGISVYKLFHDAGVFIGPALIGVLADRLGLRAAFRITAGIIAFGVLALLIFFKDVHRQSPDSAR
jgi:MFS family permease